MKKIFSLVSVFICFAAIGLLAWFMTAAQYHNVNTPAGAVEDFWRLSLEGKTDDLKQIVARTPPDFYTSTNRCAETSGEIAKKSRAASEGEMVQMSRGIGEDLIDENMNFVLQMSSKISEKNFKFYKIRDVKETGNHAIVRISYGDDETLAYQHLVLLNKEDQKWHIFMITGDWALNLENKFFAKADCN